MKIRYRKTYNAFGSILHSVDLIIPNKLFQDVLIILEGFNKSTNGKI